MKVTIEGDLKQVTEALSAPAFRPKTPRHTRVKEKAAEQDAYLAKRRLVRRAFECVRWKKERREESDILLAALTKPDCLTDSAIEIAKRILAVGPHRS